MLLLASSAADAAPRAIPVDDFLSSLGVCTHVAQGYDYRRYVAALRYLGVHAIRDAAGNVSDIITLHNQTGVMVDIFNGGDVAGLLAAGHQLAAAHALLSLEGANEPNNFPILYDQIWGGGDRSWLPVASFQRDLYAAVKQDAILKSYPVFDVSEGGAEHDNVGLQWLTIPPGMGALMPEGITYANYANAHNYVSGNCGRQVDNQAWQAADPTLDRCWDGLFGEYGRTWRKGFQGYTVEQLQVLPRVTTETGWDSVQQPGGEVQQGKMLVNTYLTQYARGWRYTFIYELVDGEGGAGNQGLFHQDMSPKPAAHFIHNLTSILAGSENGGASPPRSLKYEIHGRSETVHDLLLQKPNGVFALAIWGEQASGSSEVVVDLGEVQATVNVYDLTEGAGPVRRLTNVRDVPLTLGDHAWILQVSP